MTGEENRLRDSRSSFQGGTLRLSSLSTSALDPTDIIKSQLDADGKYCVEWVKDEDVSICSCKTPFSLFVGRHHCRVCGDIYCNSCCKERRFVEGFDRPQRVCHNCLALHQKKFVIIVVALNLLMLSPQLQAY